jgi:hypothetical protein
MYITPFALLLCLATALAGYMAVWMHNNGGIRRNIKWAYQKFTRGFTDADLWGLDSHLAEYILPRLVAFRNRGAMGHPCDFKTNEEWLAVVDDMIHGMTFVLHEELYIEDEFTDSSRERYRYHADRAQRGLEAFGEYFMNLWD